MNEKSNNNISLIGFMGVGKSTVAKRLGELLDREVISTDIFIEKEEGRSIPEIFRDSGEAYFRKIETKIVKQISSGHNLIIDCGGGVVLNSENVSNLRKNGILICLSASIDTIYERVKFDTNRPLLKVVNPKEEIKRLLEFRMPFYNQADYIVSTDNKSIDEVCAEIIKLYN